VLTRDEYFASLARTRLGSGALITDELGRVLMVEPTYKNHLEVPRGAVEAGENARQHANVNAAKNSASGLRWAGCW